VEGPTDKLKIYATGGANAWSLLDHLASDKPGGKRMILHICLLSRMPQIMIGPHPGRGCPLPLRISQTGDAKEFTCCYASQGLRVTFSYNSY